jgi:hypothetical protein
VLTIDSEQEEKREDFECAAEEEAPLSLSLSPAHILFNRIQKKYVEIVKKKKNKV